MQQWYPAQRREERQEDRKRTDEELNRREFQVSSALAEVSDFQMPRKLVSLEPSQFTTPQGANTKTDRMGNHCHRLPQPSPLCLPLQRFSHLSLSCIVAALIDPRPTKLLRAETSLRHSRVPCCSSSSSSSNYRRNYDAKNYPLLWKFSGTAIDPPSEGVIL